MGQKFPDQPLSFSLHQNYPNPFNPTTILEYSMPVESNVRIIVYNTIGQVVATLVHGVQMPGSNSIEWNASTFASGIYFYRMEATGVSNPTKTFTQVKKMILMKWVVLSVLRRSNTNPGQLTEVLFFVSYWQSLYHVVTSHGSDQLFVGSFTYLCSFFEEIN